MIPISHCKHKYPGKAGLLFLRNMSWKLGAISALNGSDYPGPSYDMEKLGNELSDSKVEKLILQARKLSLITPDTKF